VKDHHDLTELRGEELAADLAVALAGEPAA
jgi:hypothetical protein